ncbi:MAG: nuclear transport factor 2 family protein [Acidobacteriota bacterium]
MRKTDLPDPTRRMIPNAAGIAVLAVLLLIPMLSCVENEAEDEQPLFDRIQIEDMLVRYYFDLSSGKSHDLAQYYTEDAMLDVNGIVSDGREAIEALYAGFEGGEEEEAAGGRGHMLLTNPIITVDGDTATAWVIWTGIANDELNQPPSFTEQGREYDELVKVDGQWFIQKRYITSDSGLTEMWEETYKDRSFR